MTTLAALVSQPADRLAKLGATATSGDRRMVKLNDWDNRSSWDNWSRHR